MSLPETINLTDKQRAFVDAILDGRPIADAGTFAGYQSLPAAYTVLKSSKVLHAIRQGMAIRMASAAPAAWRLIVETAHDPTVDRKLRVMCGKDILDRTGFVPPKAAEASAERALEDMTRDELVAFINQAHARRAQMATDVSTPDDAAAQAQLDDMLE